MKKRVELDEDLQVALKSIIDGFEIEDRPVRERQIRIWKKLEFMWAGFTRIYWDEVAHDWRVFDDYDDNDSSYYDKEINVFRAYLESIIAALSSTVPGIKCYPDDADNPSDVLTAKGGSKIAELVYDHIDAPLLWCRALWVYCLQGMVAAYNYTAEDSDYGTVEVGKYEDKEEEVDVSTCPTCGMELAGPQLDQALQMQSDEMDEFDPSNDDVMLHDFMAHDHRPMCTTCQMQVDPQIEKRKVIINRLTGVTQKPKARQCIEVNGGLYVRVPNYARNQKETPYIAYCYETHYTNVYKKYPHLREKFKNLDMKMTSASGNEMYERWGRLSPQYYSEYPLNTPTIRNWWLRPSTFEAINDEPTRARLIKKFPDGVKCVFVNDEYADACDENLDDHWTLTRNPLSNYIHFDPLGLLLTSVQEITTELVSLTLQTIEHGIPQTFADQAVLDFNQYRNTEAVPGAIYPAKPKGGKSIGDGFYTLSTASLSKEVEPFSDSIQQMGQFVSGAMPSIWGGANAGGSSRTAAQASMSRNQSLQRLQTPWKMVNYWWKDIFSKVIPAYIENMLDDEHYVREEHGSFINIMIHKAQMDGRLGSVTTDSIDGLPMSKSQMKDVIMELMQMNNPEILAALGAPENIQMLSDAFGLTDFTIPGAGDRDKQYEEIQLLSTTAPLSDTEPSIMPEQDVDNHQIEAEICRNWLVGEKGRQCKIENEAGYRNVLLHLKMHMAMLAQLMNPQPQAQPQAQPNKGQAGPGMLRPVPQQGAA